MKLYLVLLAIVWSAFSALAAEPPKAAENALTTLMKAIANDDYSLFQSVGDESFKKGITQDAFSGVSTQLQPLLQSGYQSEFLTELVQQGFKVYLWKITPKIGKNQFIAKVVFTEGKVSGFWIQ